MSRKGYTVSVVHKTVTNMDQYSPKRNYDCVLPSWLCYPNTPNYTFSSTNATHYL